MENSAARSYNNGIDFFVSGKNIVVSARRGKDGRVVVTQSRKAEVKSKTDKRFKVIKTIILLAIAMILAIVYNFLGTFCSIEELRKVLILPLMWGGTFAYYYIIAKNPTTPNLSKYHAAEHKVLNYCDKYTDEILDCDKVMQMSCISIRCGSTVIAVLMVFITIMLPGVWYIPWLALKLIWIAISIIVSMYLWAIGKCNFLQKMVIETPNREEVEVAVLGMEECIRISK